MKRLQEIDYQTLIYLYESHVEKDRGYLKAHYHNLKRLNRHGFLTVVYNGAGVPYSVILTRRALELFRNRKHSYHRYERREHQEIQRKKSVEIQFVIYQVSKKPQCNIRYLTPHSS
ncbi:hypothetical protein ACRW9N_03710 [Listeria aquatica]|uniref:hypothetical protein n=1 Tax=Listeria aquatica TaxID=1494960 RepID=UPI003EFB0CFC